MDGDEKEQGAANGNERPADAGCGAEEPRRSTGDHLDRVGGCVVNLIGKSRRLVTHLRQSAQGEGQPTKRQALRARAIDRDLIRGEHFGQRRVSAPHPEAGHMAAPTSNLHKVETSCQTGAVHTWRF